MIGLESLLLLAALLSPQERAQTDRQLAPAERRVLSLEDGRKLRAVTRLRDGCWEVRDGEVWLILPEGLVSSWRSERELLAEMRELAARVPPDDLVRKTALAAWMIERGLLAEALNTLDQILAADAEQAEARALLARGLIPVALPRAAEDPEAAPRERVDALLRFGAQARPALREIAVVKLKSAADAALVAEALEKEIGNGVVTRRAFASLALRRLFPGTLKNALVQRALVDPSEDVRESAALGLRAAGDPALVVPLVRVLARDDLALRIHAAAALGTLGDVAAVEPLLVHLARLSPASGSSAGSPRSHLFVGNQVAYLQDYNVQIATGSSIADPIVGAVAEATQLDVRVVGIGVETVTLAAERRTICRSLAKLTGEKPSDDPERWFAWWKARAKDGDAPQSAGKR